MKKKINKSLQLNKGKGPDRRAKRTCIRYEYVSDTLQDLLDEIFSATVRRKR